MSHKAFRPIALGLFFLFCLAGCPWSSSPNVFDGAKGISMPSLGGPPAQSEPPIVEESDRGQSRSSDVEFD